MFESVVKEAEAKFNLGEKAETLLTVILGFIANEENGGIRGFAEGFEKVGLGDLFMSWVNSDANTPLSKEQTESALGEDTLKMFAGEAGADYETTVGATAFMIPQIVDELTPAGTLPAEADVERAITNYLGAEIAEDAHTPEYAGDKFDRVDASVASSADTGYLEERPSDDEQIAAEENPVLKWLLPLIILAIVIVIGFWFCGKSEPVVTNINANVNANTKINANIAP